MATSAATPQAGTHFCQACSDDRCARLGRCSRFLSQDFFWPAVTSSCEGPGEPPGDPRRSGAPDCTRPGTWLMARLIASNDLRCGVLQ